MNQFTVARHSIRSQSVAGEARTRVTSFHILTQLRAFVSVSRTFIDIWWRKIKTETFIKKEDNVFFQLKHFLWSPLGSNFSYVEWSFCLLFLVSISITFFYCLKYCESVPQTKTRTTEKGNPRRGITACSSFFWSTLPSTWGWKTLLNCANY